MTPRELAALIVRAGEREVDAGIRILWFFQRIEGLPEVTTSAVLDFFDDHAISNPNRSRLHKKLASDRRVLRGAAPGSIRLRASELDRIDALMNVSGPLGPSPSQTTNRRGHAFIGHGRSLVWRELKDFIQDRLGLSWDEFNRLPSAGLANVERLSEMLSIADIAFLVFTAEDEMGDGSVRARENVVHEAGLFQGRLGFRRAIVLLEEGCSEFTNIQGLGQIRFPSGRISAAFEEIRRVVEREITHGAVNQRA